MNDQTNNNALKIVVSTIPRQVRTLNGALFDPDDDHWTFRDSSRTINLNFTKLKVSHSILLSCKSTLAWYAENKSPYHLMNMFSRFAHYVETIGINGQVVEAITANDLLNYRSALKVKQHWYLGNISGFLRKWHAMKYVGVTDDAIALLKQLRLKGNTKGQAVLTMDPENGPYSDIEVEAIHSSLEDSYQTGQIDLADYLLVWLVMALGQRPIQYAGIKLCDLMVNSDNAGNLVYTLRVPRAKQRGQISRGELKNRVIIPQIGEKLIIRRDELRKEFKSLLADPDQAPLFPVKRLGQNGPPGFEFHRTSESLAQKLREILNCLNVNSERTGRQLNMMATRFRRTLGTRAAAEGHGELVIAELLDHSDTQNSAIYVQATPAIVERIDRAVALQLAPLAQAFSGVIIEDESYASRSCDPSSRVCDPRYDPTMKPMGNCGKHGFCGLLAPIACYTCRNFEPWVDGPHAAVLEHLIDERARLLIRSDVRIASIGDRTIYAVAEVVRRCDEIRNSRKVIHG